MVGLGKWYVVVEYKIVSLGKRYAVVEYKMMGLRKRYVVVVGYKMVGMEKGMLLLLLTIYLWEEGLLLCWVYDCGLLVVYCGCTSRRERGSFK
jgi:hypothetical protein